MSEELRKEFVERVKTDPYLFGATATYTRIQVLLDRVIDKAQTELSEVHLVPLEAFRDMLERLRTDLISQVCDERKNIEAMLEEEAELFGKEHV